MPNKLINETSPYLLQHAHNPVEWYPWGEEALQKAKDDDKPILVSIGYAACHWCHVMERESFENEAVAAIMNKHFINIKIDREERPDIDHIYMDAVQAMTGSGGWPLNVFLTPNRLPFYGGTYFPPKPVMNRASWPDVLAAVANAFKEKRDEIEQQATGMKEHLEQSNSFGINIGVDENWKNTESMDIGCANLLKAGDKVWGGFGSAPKFPQTFSIQFLLRYYQAFKNRAESHAEAALKQALLSLDKMIDGGIYDQVGGGFARYSTDTEWLAPHFEKMLYDNALLISVISEAYQLTRQPKYKNIIDQTLAFAERELMHLQNGFFSALDADSEGVEGKFYVWDLQEVKQLLGDDAELFCEYYDISEAGNWEHKNIPRVLKPPGEFADAHNLEEEKLSQLLDGGRLKLLEARSKRIRPALDDKIILGWNALMNTAYSKAYKATGNDQYRNLAIANMQFLIKAFVNAEGFLNHVWKNDHAKYPAFLDDYAYLIQALLQLQKITGDAKWLEHAKDFCKKVIDDFSVEDGFFYYTPQGQQDVIVRKKEVYDGATPSGNAIMAQNLFELGLLLDDGDWIARAERMVSSLQNVIIKYPTSFGVWLNLLQQMIVGTKEIVLIGEYEKSLQVILSKYLPYSVVMASATESQEYPLLRGKDTDKILAIYLCENYACQKPAHSVEEFLKQIED